MQSCLARLQPHSSHTSVWATHHFLSYLVSIPSLEHVLAICLDARNSPKGLLHGSGPTVFEASRCHRSNEESMPRSKHVDKPRSTAFAENSDHVQYRSMLDANAPVRTSSFTRLLRRDSLRLPCVTNDFLGCGYIISELLKM